MIFLLVISTPNQMINMRENSLTTFSDIIPEPNSGSKPWKTCLSYSNSHVNHTSISINGNVDFLSQAANEGWNGTGTSVDPIIITGYKISNESGCLLEIKNTNLHFNVTNNLFDGEKGILEVAISLENVTHGTITNNVIINLNGTTNEDGGNILGISIVNATTLTFINNTFNNIIGGHGRNGGAAIGISIVNATTLTFINNTLNNIIGGKATYSFGQDRGGDGGDAIGISIVNTTMLTFINNTFQSIEASNGASAPLGGGDGGNGIGLSLKEVTNVTVKNNKMCFITGGEGGLSSWSNIVHNGDSIGFLFITARKITINNNILYTISGTGISLSNVNYSAIQDNLITKINGKVGETVRMGGTNGEPVVGVKIMEVNYCIICGNIITNNKGGNGGQEYGLGCSGSGGSAVGVYIKNSNYNTVFNNTVSTIIGGDGGKGVFTCPGGNGGSSTGIYLAECNKTIIENNTISNIFGGKIGSSSKSGGEGGKGIGIWLINNIFSNLTNNIVVNITGGLAGEANGKDGLTAAMYSYISEQIWAYEPLAHLTEAKNYTIFFSYGVGLLYYRANGDEWISINVENTNNYIFTPALLSKGKIWEWYCIKDDSCQTEILTFTVSFSYNPSSVSPVNFPSFDLIPLIVSLIIIAILESKRRKFPESNHFYKFP
ncbi:MAG: hypothetical protein ACFFDI_20075 [Promethearchaeota archaeon]